MRSVFVRRLQALTVAWVIVLGALAPGRLPVAAQSRRQPPTAPQKKNQRPGDQQPQTDEQQQPLPPDIFNKPTEGEIVKVAANLVNVEATVVNKKTKQLMTGLTKANFAIFEDGVRQEITNFNTPEAKLNVAVVVEFSKISEILGFYGSSGFDDGRREVIIPAMMFMRDAVSRGDYISCVAYDMRATPLTDFTNDPARVNQVINLLARNHPAFRETNLFDALKLTLVGGRGDSVVLEDAKEGTTEYAGLVSVEGRRRAVFLISSGLDTFSKINYDQARKIAQNAGIPIYIIGTGNLFFKKYADRLGATDSLDGFPGRMTLYQAQNTLQTFAKETGGMYIPVTFEGELGSALSSINALMRNQYSLGYNPGDKRDGKQHKIVVKVDVDGDGQFDDAVYDVQHRRFYNAPKG
ncbi:MAG TPA: VWA domain-containing protein [Pyrinomonadaceae bacterium]|jgi:VWFA-related protein